MYCVCDGVQPKGADRKHKTDREKIERRSASEKVILCCVVFITLTVYETFVVWHNGPTVWNSLPDSLCDPALSSDRFRQLLVV